MYVFWYDLIYFYSYLLYSNMIICAFNTFQYLCRIKWLDFYFSIYFFWQTTYNREWLNMKRYKLWYTCNQKIDFNQNATSMGIYFWQDVYDL